jgi:hypothetical protein
MTLGFLNLREPIKGLETPHPYFGNPATIPPSSIGV